MVPMPRVTETTQLAARVPVKLVKRLEKIAKADDRTLSYVVRVALREYADAVENDKEAA